MAQRQVVALKREFERLPGLSATSVAPGEPERRTSRIPAPSASREESDTNSWKYVGFEDLFRGSQDEIRSRLESYLPIFEGARDVLDIGCWRGEFLDLMRGRGIGARGLDLNHEMVEVCRSRGLDAIEGDALRYLRTLPDGALGGLSAAQVVEHLEPSYLMQLLDQAQRVLRPGSPIVLETINVACWLAFFESYIRDITHVRPLHPDTLKYLVTASGFVDVEVRFRAPVPPADRLQPAPKALRQVGDSAGALAAMADTFDGNMERLNRMMFTHLDYAVVGHRP